MSQPKIVQSLNVLHIPTMNTYEAVLLDGKEGLKLIGTDTILTDGDLPPVDAMIVVLPVIPEVGDLVASYLEGELVYGEIKQIGDNSTFVIDFYDIGAVSLSRNQFHVTATTSSIPNDELSEGLNVIVVDGDENFPTGSRAIITHVGVTKGIPSKTVILARNALEWVWDINEVGFRYPDPTLVDFDFTDDPEQVDLGSDATVVLDFDSVDQQAQASIEGELREVAELGDENFSFYVTDAAGNPVDWKDLPEEARAALSKVADEVKTQGGDEVEEKTAQPSTFDFFAMIIGELAEMVRQEELNHLAEASINDQLDHEDFVEVLGIELDQRLDGAMKKLSLGMNLVGRMASNASDELGYRQLQAVGEDLAETRGLLFEVSKARLDIVADTTVNRSLQSNYGEMVDALN